MEEIKQAVTAALLEAGIAAEVRDPVRVFPRLTRPRAAVDIRSLRAGSGSLFDYLGTEDTAESGPVERYGRKVEATAEVCIFADTCARAETAAEAAVRALLAMKPVRVLALEQRQAEFDKVTDCFTAQITLEISAWLIARSAGDEQEFLDFRLEGELR